MSVSELQFPAEPVNVRTARLVAGAIARQVGLDEVDVEDIRLAVGEACSLALVGAQTVRLVFEAEDSMLGISVSSDVDFTPAPDELALVVLQSLVTDLELSESGLKMAWPVIF